MQKNRTPNTRPRRQGIRVKKLIFVPHKISVESSNKHHTPSGRSTPQTHTTTTHRTRQRHSGTVRRIKPSIPCRGERKGVSARTTTTKNRQPGKCGGGEGLIQPRNLSSNDTVKCRQKRLSDLVIITDRRRGREAHRHINVPQQETSPTHGLDQSGANQRRGD